MLGLWWDCLLRVYHLLVVWHHGWVHVAPEEVAVEEVIELRQAVPCVDAQWHVEDAVQFLQCLLLGLG